MLTFERHDRVKIRQPYVARRTGSVVWFWKLHDKFVTSFCMAKTLKEMKVAIPVSGRGEGVGTRNMGDSQTWTWCRRCAAICLLLAACAEGGEQRSSTESSPPTPAKTEEIPIAPMSSVSNVQHTYYQGYLADVLAGDAKTASAQYLRVLGRASEAPKLAAQAALRLAQRAEVAHRRRVALDFAVRASVLGGDVPIIKQRAQRLQKRLSTVRAQDIEVRGPRAGTLLQGASPPVAKKFAAAEALLASYHRRRLKPRLEQLGASMRSKRSAMEGAVRAYREVAESGESVAVVAAEFRIASAYYDYSLSLSFGLPPELEPEVAQSLRSTLRMEVRSDRAKARSAYQRSIAAGKKAGVEAQGWSEAAELGLSSVEDLLR